MKKSDYILNLAFWFFFCGSLFSQPIVQSFYSYKTIESDHFKIHFPGQYQDFAYYFLNLAETIHKNLKKTYFIDNAKTNLVLVFNHDVSNAYTTVHGLDTIVFYLTPPETGTFANYKNWYEQLIIHEYTHVITLRPYQHFLNYTFRLFFGVPPNLALPNGLIEGIAVIEESYQKDEGRLFDANTNSLIRNQLLYHKFPSIEEILGGSYYWPMGNINYLYGARYIQTILEQENKNQFVSIFYSKNLPILLSKRFEENQLKDYEFYFQKLKEKEYIFYKNWFITKTKNPTTPYEQLTFNGGWKSYLKIFNNNFYYFEKSSYRSSGIYQLTENQLVYKALHLNNYFIDSHFIITSEPVFFNGDNIIQHNIFINQKELIEDNLQTTRKWNPLFYKDHLIFLEKEDPYIRWVLVPLIKKGNDYFIQNDSKKIFFKTSFFNTIDFPTIIQEDLYFILKLNDSRKHILIKCNLYNYHCKSIFSSEGEITTLSSFNHKIFFSSNINENYEIYEYDLEKNQIIQRTNSFLNAKFPVYSNDYLYFIGETYNGYEVFRIPEKYLLNIDAKNYFSFEDVNLEEIKEFSLPKNPLQSYDYRLKEFRLYLDGIFANNQSDVALHFSGYDPLRRHELNFGTGIFDDYTLYFISYSYNRFLPNLQFAFVKTNPFESDKNCWTLLNSSLRNSLCKIVYGFERYHLGFLYPFRFRLLKSNTLIGLNHQKNRNAFYNSNAVYQYNDFDQYSLIFLQSFYYFEHYYYSISPENGFNLEFRIEHFPYKWNKITFYDSFKPYNQFYTYSNISILSEFFLPWFVQNHVPYVSFFTNFNKGEDYQFVRNRLAIYQYGIATKDSTYGSGNIVSSVEYRFPLVYSSKRIFWFLPEVGLHWIMLAPFYQMGKSFEKSIYEDKKIFYSKGIRATLKLYAFFLPFYLNVIYAKGTEEQISFGFSFDANFRMQSLQHLQHPEYLPPTWRYK